MSCWALFAASLTGSNWLGIFLRQSSTVIRAIGFRLSVYRSRQKKQKSQQTLTVNTPEWLAQVGAGTYEGTNITGETAVKETPFTARRN